jgi:arabinose-5-phosphate isomerase
MKNRADIIDVARKAIEMELESITRLVDFLTDGFAQCVELIANSSGRVVITGIGKSAIIAQKIVATLNSTGTPAIFMHAADAIHGDLGIIQKNDVVMCLSKSGNTPEIKVLIPLLKARGNKLIAMVSELESVLARQADFIIQAYVSKEACPNNLAPTSSTTAQLVMGDALAIALLDYRNFTPDDFAHYHPGGSLGKRLYLRVDDLYKNNERPMVTPDESIGNVIIEMTSKRLGAAVVSNDANQVLGIITDGDLRRMLLSGKAMELLTAKDIMGTAPKVINETELAVTAYEMMRKNNITQLVVVNNGLYKGIVHIHDILKEGIV